MSTQMIIRIDDKLKAKFAQLAKSEGKTTSHVVRELIEVYVRDHDMGGYIDDLWNRIGSQLSAKGYSADDVSDAVAASRRKKP